MNTYDYLRISRNNFAEERKLYSDRDVLIEILFTLELIRNFLITKPQEANHDE